MKPRRAGFSLYLSFLLSSLLLFVFGDSGLKQYQALTSYRDILTSNIEELEEIHRRLSAEAESLRSDPERIALQARELEFFQEDERIVRLDNRAPPAGSYLVGRQVIRTRGEPRSDTILRIVCAALPFGIYGFLRFLRRRRYCAHPESR
jgi:cell division protein FtsB